MVIGTVKEIKNNEFRVGLTPNCVKSYVLNGNVVLVEQGAGEGSGFSDEEYENSGAEIIPGAAGVWNSCDMLIKVKEPIESEYHYLREDLILYTYLHLAADRDLTEIL
jgi:alanine dehydrogenase